MESKRVQLTNGNCRQESYAILCSDVSHAYDSGSSSVTVLDHLNIKVPLGCIYGLLGPSGCGKTTFLKCLMGRKKPDAGLIQLFGYPPGSLENEIPGRGIGYMPQEIAVQDDMTINEMLFYFGRINMVDDETIRKRVNNLVMTLNLPEKSRIIRNLSGGQRRRVSFAISVLHKPRLLILDEPTVGVDPMLRKVIWDQLGEFSVKDRMTVIVTTHYIEETRKADLVGFLNGGKLLYDGSPEAAMVKYNAPSLEKVFYELCLHGSKSEDYQAPCATSNKMLVCSRLKANVQPRSVRIQKWFSIVFILVQKILLQTKRNPGALICQFILPFLTIAVLFTCFGTIPHGLSLYVVNEENPPDLSLLFLESVQQHKYMMSEQVNFTDINYALNLARTAKVSAVVHIKPNFSEAIMLRADIDNEITDHDLDMSTIRLHTDLSNSLVNLFVTRAFEQSFLNFLVKLRQELNTKSLSLDVPIKAENIDDVQLEDLVVPVLIGFLVLIAYTMTFSVTIFVVLTEKLDNIFDRNYAAGITPSQIILAHLVSRFVYSCAVSALMYIFTIYVYEITSKGSILLGLTVTLFITFTGLCHGLATSAMFNNYFFCCSVAQGIIILLFIVSGVVWPIEAIPYWMRFLGHVSPVHIPTEALRAIIMKGFDLQSHLVLQTFFVCSVWSLVFLGLSIVLLHYSK